VFVQDESSIGELDNQHAFLIVDGFRAYEVCLLIDDIGNTLKLP
jgi:hypothetical protein